MFLLYMQFLIMHIDKLVGKGIPFPVIAELIITNLAYMVVLAAPMSVLVSTLMAFGKFAEWNEFSATMAAGVNPIRLINPVLGLSVILCLFLVWFANDVLPDANQRARSLFIDIRLKKPGFDLQPNVFYDGIDGYRFHVKQMPAGTDSLYEITLFQSASSNRNKAIIRAQRGFMESRNKQTLTLTLNNGSMLRFIPPHRGRDELYEITDFEQYRIRFDLSDLSFTRSNPDRRRRSDRTMTSRAMLATVDSLRRDIASETEKYVDRMDRTLKRVRPESESPPPNPEEITPSQPKEIQNPQPGTLASSVLGVVNLWYDDGNRSAGPTDSLQPRDTLKSEVQVPFLVINHLKEHKQKRRVIETTLRTLRDQRSNYESMISSINWRKSRIAQFLVEVHKKFSIPFACIVFVLIGAPLGMLTKKGNLGYAALISAFFLTYYWISIIQGEKLADRLFISPFMGMWFANITLGIAGIGLTLYLTTPLRRFIRDTEPESEKENGKEAKPS